MEEKTKIAPKRNQCIHWKHDVKHIKKYNVQPNCLTCDGYEKDARKYGWECYLPYSKWRGGSWEPTKIE